MSDERESFEKWALDQEKGHSYWLPNAFERFDNQYTEPSIDIAWEAWQAGRESGLRAGLEALRGERLEEPAEERCPTCGSRNRGARGLIPPPPERHVHVGNDYCPDPWHSAKVAPPADGRTISFPREPKIAPEPPSPRCERCELANKRIAELYGEVNGIKQLLPPGMTVEKFIKGWRETEDK